MAEKLGRRQVVTFEDLLSAMMCETVAMRRVLVRLLDTYPTGNPAAG